MRPNTASLTRKGACHTHLALMLPKAFMTIVSMMMVMVMNVIVVVQEAIQGRSSSSSCCSKSCSSCSKALWAVPTLRLQHKAWHAQAPWECWRTACSSRRQLQVAFLSGAQHYPGQQLHYAVHALGPNEKCMQTELAQVLLHNVRHQTGALD